MLFFKKLQKDKKGNMYVEIVVKLLIAGMLLVMTMHIFALVIKYQHVVYSAKTITKVVEQDGYFGSNAEDMLKQLNQNFNTNMKMQIKDVSYFDSTKKIQFRNSFTIKITDEYKLPIITPHGHEGINISVPMETEIVGISEVYWK